MRKTIGFCAALLVVLAVILGGCGSAKTVAPGEVYSPRESSSTSSDYLGEEAGGMLPIAEDEPAAGADQNSGVGILVPGVDTERKLVYTADISIETSAFSEQYALISRLVSEAGGYVSSESTYGTPPVEYGDPGRESSLTVRIPIEKLESFLAELEQGGGVISKNMNVQDATDRYYDLDNRIAMLETQYDKLNGYLQEAATIEDVIALEDRMSQILYELDGLKGNLKGLENDISYSTVIIDITEIVKAGTVVVQKESLWERIKEGLASVIKEIGLFFENALVFIIVALPVLVIIGVATLVIVLIVRAVKRRKYKPPVQEKKED